MGTQAPHSVCRSIREVGGWVSPFLSAAFFPLPSFLCLLSFIIGALANEEGNDDWEGYLFWIGSSYVYSKVIDRDGCMRISQYDGSCASCFMRSMTGGLSEKKQAF